MHTSVRASLSTENLNVNLLDLEKLIQDKMGDWFQPGIEIANVPGEMLVDEFIKMLSVSAPTDHRSQGMLVQTNILVGKILRAIVFVIPRGRSAAANFVILDFKTNTVSLRLRGEAVWRLRANNTFLNFPIDKLKEIQSKTTTNHFGLVSGYVEGQDFIIVNSEKDDSRMTLLETYQEYLERRVKGTTMFSEVVRAYMVRRKRGGHKPVNSTRHPYTPFNQTIFVDHADVPYAEVEKYLFSFGKVFTDILDKFEDEITEAMYKRDEADRHLKNVTEIFNKELVRFTRH